MTHFLVTEEKPDGYKLEDILGLVRKDMLTRALKIADDTRPEAHHVMRNNMKILGLLSEAMALAEDSTRILDKAFGTNAKGGPPRIGKA
ncbi:MAG: histidine kinase [Proteobacteria bacterium]|nr:histidine kinase [Pseudomonadota bacterium]